MKKQAQVGIGTLIVFIAVVLLATVASGVMLKTSGMLQQRAMITQEQSVKEVATNIRVTEVIGYSQDAANITAIGLAVELASGSEALRYEDILLNYHSGNVYIPAIFYEKSENNYTVAFIRNATDNYILERGETAQLWFNLSANPNAVPLKPAREFTMTVIPLGGQAALVIKIVPNTINQKYILEWG